MTAPRGRAHKLCIFCNSPNVSKEHFYSAWMYDLLPSVNRLGHASRIVTRHPLEGINIGREIERPAPLTTKKFRAPCERCNSTWMNRIEGAARPFLTEMILGHEVVLDEPAQLAVGRWIALKIMISEYAYKDSTMTPAEDRTRFKETQTIPSYYRIYIGKHSASEDAGHFSASTTNSLPGAPPPPMNGMAKNVQQSSFLAGRLVVHVNASRVDGFNIEDRIKVPRVHEEMRIWPLARTNFEWPSGPVLGTSDLNYLFFSWDRFASGDGVAWAGENPAH